MDVIVEKKKCTGCTACMNICPKGAISFIELGDGFKYPNIDQNKCINCGLCQKTCPVLNTVNNKSLNKCYAGYNKDEDSLVNKASSGSIFELIANHILEQNGIVVGAMFDENNKLKHIAIENKKDLLSLKGSKYLQSDLGTIFEYIKKNIKSRKVLFVGTPCQVSGLKSVIKGDNLICIDLICHGVPSPKLFEKYIKELEEENNEKIIDYDFRNKSTGWNNYSNTITFETKKVSELQKDNKYMKLFLSDVALRESCYKCNFKLGNKYSDITLGDFWGISNSYPEMYNEKGVSAIIINTELGKSIFENIKGNLIYKECELDKILEGNSSLSNSSKRPKKRNDFFESINNLSVAQLAQKYIKKECIVIRVKNKVRRVLNIK